MECKNQNEMKHAEGINFDSWWYNLSTKSSHVTKSKNLDPQHSTVWRFYYVSVKVPKGIHMHAFLSLVSANSFIHSFIHHHRPLVLPFQNGDLL